MSLDKRKLNESVERQIRSAIPSMVKNIQEATFGERIKAVGRGLGSLGSELGQRMKAAAINQWTSVAQQTHEYSQQAARDILYHHYGERLGHKPSYISMVLNDYHKTMPRRPLKDEPVLHPVTGLPQFHPPTHPTLAGQMITQPNTSYGLEMREYENKKAEFLERQKLLNQIEGLHRSIPSLGRFADTAQASSSVAKTIAQSNALQRQATLAANRANTIKRSRKWTP